MQSAAAVALMPLLIFCCWLHCSNAFQLARQPQIAPFSWGISTPICTWFLGPPEATTQSASRSVQSFFAGFMNVTNRQTDTHTTVLCL